MGNVQIIQPNEVYHVFNKAVDKNLLFRDQYDYDKFKHRMQIHLSDVLEFYAYSLLPNHFLFSLE